MATINDSPLSPINSEASVDLYTSSEDIWTLLSGGQSIWSQQRRNFGSLESIRGHVASIARDQCGCCFLQMMIDEGTPEEIEMILSEVKDHSHELMTHHFGNYLIQKIFEASTLTDDQIDRILHSIIMNEQQLMHVCINDHG